MKSELKLEISESLLLEIISNSFTNGKLSDPKRDYVFDSDVLESLKDYGDINKLVIKFYNLEIIDGFLKVLVDNNKFKPIQTYVIKTNDDKWSFY